MSVDRLQDSVQVGPSTPVSDPYLPFGVNVPRLVSSQLNLKLRLPRMTRWRVLRHASSPLSVRSTT